MNDEDSRSNDVPGPSRTKKRRSDNAKEDSSVVEDDPLDIKVSILREFFISLLPPLKKSQSGMNIFSLNYAENSSKTSMGNFI